MNKIRNKIARSVTISIIFSTLLALSGMAVIASADDMPKANVFSGTVLVDGEYVNSGTITAYINGAPSGDDGVIENGYYYICVTGNESDDITFKINDTMAVNDTMADQTAALTASYQPQKLNISKGDPPAGDPPARPSTATGDAMPTGTDAQPVSPSWENATSVPSVTPAESTTPAETSTKKLAEKPEAKGLLPGFEAVFAIAGLLAVAYLIRRR